MPPPAPPAATAGTEPEAQAPPQEAPKKKRGFWSRLLGIGKDGDDDNQKKPVDEKSRRKKGGE